MSAEPWWSAFGQVIDEAEVAPGPARDLAQLVRDRNSDTVRLSEIRRDLQKGYTFLALEVSVQRPQKLAAPIRKVEPIVVLFTDGGARPGVFSGREDFPDTPHQNWMPDGAAASLCVDDRPWEEAKLSYTAADFLWRIELWLSKAACGELHDQAQPLDPIFLKSGDTLLLPASVIENAGQPAELAGYFRQDNPTCIIATPYPEAATGALGFAVVTYQLPPQAMPRLRRAPRTLGALDAELKKNGLDLVGDLKARIRSWAGGGASAQRLRERLVIVVQFPMTAGGVAANDIRAFLPEGIIGDLGVALGTLAHGLDGKSFIVAMPAGECQADGLPVYHAEVQLQFNRDMAAAISGQEKADERRAVLIGAGSLGSQVALFLAREGRFRWTVVDDDMLLPHNLARHGLFRSHIAAPKAKALAYEISGLLFGEPCDAIADDVLSPSGEAEKSLTTSLAEADLIIDASASVAVSRHISDHINTKARRVSVFFNPAGTSAVLLAEDAERTITLRDLEAQYYRLVLTEPSLADHLVGVREGVRYSGSCRALTNRIPASNAGLLSALIAQGIATAASKPDAHIKVCTLTDEGGVDVIARPGAEVFSTATGDWEVRRDRGLLEQLADMRRQKLPRETGGVLLGIADMSRRSIHLAYAMPEPIDSEGSVTAFERGIVDLTKDIEIARARTMEQLRYVGEWHSHPKYSRANPSGRDLVQLAWLGTELAKEGLPGLMMIAGDFGDFRLALTVDIPEASERLDAAG